MAELRCKVGDMVVVIDSSVGPGGESVGFFGTVKEWLGENPHFNGKPWCTGRGSAWLVEWAHPIPTTDGLYKVCPAPDAWLKPIRGPKVAPKEVSKTAPRVKEVV